MATPRVTALIEQIRTERPNDESLVELLRLERVSEWQLQEQCELLQGVGQIWPFAGVQSRQFMATVIRRWSLLSVVWRFPNSREIVQVTTDGAYWIEDETRQSSHGVG